MAANHLEQLLAEWYEFQGYYLRRNTPVGRLPRGGYACELDIVGFHPITRHLIHLEASLDADSWERREERYERKFRLGREYIPQLFTGLDLPAGIDQRAVLVFASKGKKTTIGGGKIVLAAEIVEEILTALRGRQMATNMIPEQMPIMRTLQFVAEYRHSVLRALGDRTSATLL
jgi:hypothetical protein